jgi:hypothetical protein
MSPRLQQLAIAQICINRAVHEGNKSKPDELYIDECISDAQSELAEATQTEIKRRKRAAMTKRKAA